MAGPTLSPITFTLEEADVLLLALAMLGAAEEISDLVEEETAEDLASPIASAWDRIAAALPPEPPYRPRRGERPVVRMILGAMAAEHRLLLDYTDGKGVQTQRLVWPILLEEGGMLAAWCETRQDFRHFRLDRIAAVEQTGERYPARRRVLLAGWQHQQQEQGNW
jgi:predicted DNA-binding transcriptional regulator YafY